MPDPDILAYPSVRIDGSVPMFADGSVSPGTLTTLGPCEADHPLLGSYTEDWTGWGLPLE